MLPHFAQLPPGAAPHSKRGAHIVAVGPAPNRSATVGPAPNRSATVGQAPPAPNRSAAVGPTAKPQHPNPSTSALTPSVAFRH